MKAVERECHWLVRNRIEALIARNLVSKHAEHQSPSASGHEFPIRLHRRFAQHIATFEFMMNPFSYLLDVQELPPLDFNALSCWPDQNPHRLLFGNMSEFWLIKRLPE